MWRKANTIIAVLVTMSLLSCHHCHHGTTDGEHVDAAIYTLHLLAMLLIVTIVLLTSTIALFVMKRREQKLRERNMLERIVMLRMESIRNRITPHFIYNALNHFAQDARSQDHESLMRLVQLLRREEEMASEFCTNLKDELSFIDYYVSIERQSMSEDFTYLKRIEDGIDTTQVQLPSMIIQIFVENAIKHGLRAIPTPHSEPPTLEIVVSGSDRGIVIEVLDNGPGLKSHAQMEAKTGLNVVRQTVSLLNDKNSAKMDFGVEPRADRSGCRAFLLIPKDYEVSL